MSRAKAASRVAASNVAASLAALLSPARAEASRRNGAKSRGPVTPDGKARSAQNALKHGLRAQKHLVLPGEDAAAFAALEAALIEELAPEGALQTVLAQRVVAAAWRLQRAEQIEAEIFVREMKGPFGDGDLGLALIRDGNGARAFDTLLRYRGAAQAELFRTLRTLKALQAEAQEAAEVAPPPRRAQAQLAAPDQAPLEALPSKPEARANPGKSRCESGRAPSSPGPEAGAPGRARLAATEPALAATPRVAARARENNQMNPRASRILAIPAGRRNGA